MISTRTGALLAALLASAAASAADVTPVTAPASEQQSLRAVRDKETGRLRAATAQEMADMDAAASAARVARGEPAEPVAKPLVVRQHANGMRSAVLGPEFMVTIRGQRDANGRIVQSHEHPAHEHGALKQQAPTE